MNTALKQAAGRLAATLNPQCEFRRAVFILGHMRCGSTALSHVLCGHDAISGFGEAHLAYDHPGSLGPLALAQMRRSAWKPRARYLFDKILHSRYDRAVDPRFHDARAVFLIRAPSETIRSIRHLFAAIGSDEYPTDAAVADYYEERLTRLCASWTRFSAGQRIGLSFAELTGAPELALARISSVLDLSPPLANRYDRLDRAVIPGVGDPLSSHKFNAIVRTDQASKTPGAARPLQLAAARKSDLEELYREACRLFAYDRELGVNGIPTP